MKLYNSIFVFLIIISNFTHIIRSQTLNQNDYDCLVNIMKAFTSDIPKNASGLYDFSLKTIAIRPFSVSNNEVVQLAITQTKDLPAVDPSILSCLPKLTNVQLKEMRIDLTPLLSSGFLPSKLTSMTIDMQSGYNLNLSKLNPNLSNMVISIYGQQTDLLINFSMINTTSLFSIKKSDSGSGSLVFTSSNCKISYYNDLDSKMWSPRSLTLYSNNFPSFKNIKSSATTLYLNDGFDSNSLNDNIGTLQNTSNFKLIGPNSRVQFPSNIENLNTASFYYFTLEMSFSTPSKIFDLSKSSFSYIDFSKLGRLFHYNGLMPFVFNSNKLYSLYFTDAYIENFVLDDWVSTYSALGLLVLKNNSMNGQLTKLNGPGTLSVLDISNNNITGTIDESFCTVTLNAANNRLYGELPTCITCFLPAIYYYFEGNNFTNYDNPPPCTTIVPNIIREDVDSNQWKFYIFGRNLGIGVTPRIRADPDYPNFIPLQISTLIPSTLISFDLSKDYEPPRLITLYYENSELDLDNYTLTWDPWVPLVETVDWSGNTLIFEGSDFTYNTSLIDIEIDSVKCMVNSATFYRINCTLAKTYSNTDHITIVTIGSLYSQITLIKDSFNIIINCSSDCGYPIGNGYCKSDTGLCSCNTNWQSYDCSIPYVRCPTNPQGTLCFGHGSCNNQTGICTCDLDYYGDSCQYINCKYPTCSNNGVCNQNTGSCVCNNRYFGESCEFKQCVSPSCSNNGNCNTTNGICLCDQEYYGESCQFKQCKDPTCSNNGKCNVNSGICECSNSGIYKWFGDSCQLPYHFISSIEPSSELGGSAVFNGWFGNRNDSLSVSIGGKICTVISTSNQSIICDAPPGKGSHIISIIQNNYEWSSNIIVYIYGKLSFTCPNDCTNSSYGKCDTLTGYCSCYGSYGGPDCSSIRNIGDIIQSESKSENSNSQDAIVFPPNESHINESTGSTTINNQKTSFEISIYSLVEIDVFGNQVANYSLQSNWIKKSSTNSLVHTLEQTIQNQQCTIQYIIEEIQLDKEFSFAGVNFTVLASSFKMSIKISKYQYLNNLNTLQLLMKSSVSDINSDKYGNCNDQDSQVTTIGDENTLNYISIKKDSKEISGHFVNHLLSDDRPSFMSTNIVSTSNNSIIVAMNLPHFASSLVIDPDFSILLSTNFKSSCPKTQNNSKSWVIPVSVVIPVVFIASLIGLSLYLYRKFKIERPFAKKMKSLNKIN